jgi:hypothetical protein
LEGTGKKMRHVKARHLGDVRSRQFTAWVQETVTLNTEASGPK